jgi:hypothetical protein
MNGAPDNPRAWSGMTLRVRILLAGAVALSVASLVWTRRDRAPVAAAAPAEQPMPTRLEPEALSQAEADREAPAVSGGYRREVVRPNPVKNVADAGAPADDPPAVQQSGGPASRRRDEKKTLPEIFRMPPDPRTAPAPAAPAGTEKKAETRTDPAVAGEFAPFGRLVKCQLVDTVDSVTARSEPIVALVTEDVDWNGNVIIPAGTEAFSYARPEPVLDALGVGRLVDNGEWTLVLPGDSWRENGRELILKARAIDRRESVLTSRGGVLSWGADDGADGLIGTTLSTLDNKEIKLFAAAAIGGMAQGFAAIAERQEPAPGVAGALGATQIAPTLGNAVAGSIGNGAADLMSQMAARIRDEIAKRGVYVRVPAGKQFYLFVEQTIDPRMAAVGLRLPARGNAR